MIIRIEKTKNFTTISNEVARKKNFSARAKGLFYYMMTLPDDWKLNKKELFTHFTEGRDALNNAMKELEDAGYLRITQGKDDQGKYKPSEYTLYETSQKKPYTENPFTGKPFTGNPFTENPQLLNTEELNTNNTNNTSCPADNNCPSDNIPYQEVIDYFNDRCLCSFRASTKKTRELIRARWKEGFRLDDFKKVIDTKASQWVSDNNMCKYLRPITLFGTKFESYLQEVQ